MSVSVDLALDDSTIRALITGSDGPVARDMIRRAERVANLAKRLCPVDTGRLRNSITYSLGRRGDLPVGVIAAGGSTVVYARYVHDGTGIYGPSRTPIRPTSGRYLVFTPRGSSGPVFARSVKGSPARPFLTDALVAAV
jgi:hypothetical protein